MTDFREQEHRFMICAKEGASIDEVIKIIESKGIKVIDKRVADIGVLYCEAKGSVYEQVFNSKLGEKECKCTPGEPSPLTERTHSYVTNLAPAIIPDDLKKYVDIVDDVGQHMHLA